MQTNPTHAMERVKRARDKQSGALYGLTQSSRLLLRESRAFREAQKDEDQ